MTPRILLVDDDADDREIITDALKALNADIQVATADNGEEALRILSGLLTNEKVPCLIVLDLNMPKMNGAQALKALKIHEEFQKVSVIIYSTSINDVEREKCLKLGAHSYISKPLSYNECLQTAKLFLSLCEAKSYPSI